MGYDAANIGKARLKVELLPNSPFNAIPQQEFAYYFTEDNLSDMEHVNIAACPAPFNGFRIDEKLDNYDNYLVDNEVTLLEEAKIVNDGIAVPVNQAATLNAARAEELRPKDKRQRDFFTWMVDENLFLNEGGTAAATTGSPSDATAASTGASNAGSANPSPVNFATAAARTDNTPTWTYNLKVKPGAGNNASALSPFMTRSAPSPTKPVHWGVTMISSLARNQPFELLFYHEGQVQTVAEQVATPLKARFQGIDLDLTKKAYFALEMGRGTLHHFLILFVQDLSPRMYALSGNASARTATLLSEFSSFSGEKLFNPENSYITLKVEPVAAGMVISSNQFGSTPWIVQGAGDAPLFVGEGQLSLYSGNVQAGFLMRPVQYLKSGEFITPKVNIIQVGDDSRQPTCTTAIKGLGEDQQNASYTISASGGSGSTAEVHAVDSELVNNKKIKTFIEQDAHEKPLTNGKRKVITTLISSEDSGSSQSASSGPPDSGAIKKVDYQVHITLQSTNLTQGNGYVVENGRSPYVWQARCELAQTSEGQSVGNGIDISCDVLSCELTNNSTSYNELSHTGTLKVLNKPRKAGGIDYRGYMNRAVYIRISGWWENGAGHDPGADERTIFEGMSIGATVDTQRERETVTFKLEDYMNALEGGKFILSPYYDGMSAPLAVRDIAKQLGIAEEKILSGDSQIKGSDQSKSFVLPFNNPFEEPQFRFKDGSSYKAAVVRIAVLDGKVVYFDNKGNFHYDPIPGGIFGDENTTPKVDFFTSVSAAPSAKQVAWNVSSFSRQINDTYNVLQVSTIDKDTGGIVTIADANEAAIFDPTAEGYLGYRKHLIIKEPSLGSVSAAGRYFQNYRERIFIPPLTVRFETYGYSGLKPLDTITLDGQKMRILNLQLHLDAKENQYWMNIEGEWFFSAGKWQNPAVAGAGAASSGSPSG